MSYRELYVTPSKPLLGLSFDFEESDYVLLGVPFDRTSSFRSGSKFTPFTLREYVEQLETYSVRSGVDVEEVKLCDLGNLHETLSVEEMVRMVNRVTSEIVGESKIPILIGGEHTLTLGAIQAYRDIQVVFLDAHFDLRDEYLGFRICHATVARRIVELPNVDLTVHLGVRAFCKEELKYALDKKLRYITTLNLRRNLRKALERAEKEIDLEQPVYLSIDVDVLDPAYAPGVANPEPDGLNLSTVLDILSWASRFTIVGLDLVEATPIYDNGLTMIQTSKLLIEALSFLEARRRGCLSQL